MSGEAIPRRPGEGGCRCSSSACWDAVTGRCGACGGLYRAAGFGWDGLMQRPAERNARRGALVAGLPGHEDPLDPMGLGPPEVTRAKG